MAGEQAAEKSGEAIKVEKVEGEAEQEAVPLPASVQLLLDIRENVRQLEKASARGDDRVSASLSRHNRQVRQGLSPALLQTLVDEIVPQKPDCLKQSLTNYIQHTKSQAMDDRSDAEDLRTYLSEKGSKAILPKTSAPIPEVELYLSLLVAMYLIDNNLHQQSAALLEGLVDRVQKLNRRSLDRFSAKLYYFMSLCYEVQGKLKDLRPKLISLHRSACLRHDEPGQVVLSNYILRSFLLERLYSQADKFRLNSVFPEGRSNYQSARYLYYLGKISSVQLHYTDAYDYLNQALRKAPTKAALGFRQAATKLLVIVQLLMGEIPERSLFLGAQLRRSLKPYFRLTQSVRVGDLAQFSQIQKEYHQLFEKDQVANLITRLRFNVIKTGLRKISVSYSRISIADVASKLALSSLEDAEYIIAKAIHDGVIDAVIDRKMGFVFSNDTVDVYSTNEPQAAFHRRIKFCLEVHNESVKSMRFPDKEQEDNEEEHEHDDLLEVLEEELKEEDLGDLMED